MLSNIDYGELYIVPWNTTSFYELQSIDDWNVSRRKFLIENSLVVILDCQRRLTLQNAFRTEHYIVKVLTADGDLVYLTASEAALNQFWKKAVK